MTNRRTQGTRNSRAPGQQLAQVRRRVRGRGDYDQSISKIDNSAARLEAKIDHLEKSINKKATVKGAASTIGRTLGNFAGQGDLGAMAGSALAKFFGHGDYQIKGNSLMSGSTTVPRFDGKRGTRITEREFLGDIISGPLTGGATDFTVQTFLLNPTDSNSFPWLSRFAGLYDQWEPNGIIFEFVSTSSEFNGTSQALGAVIMATDYDPFDPPFSTKQEMENADYSCSTKPSLGLQHGIECAPTERPTEVLYTSTSNGAPLTNFTLGNFSVATKGCSAAAVVLGELWVSYDITFFKKQYDYNLSRPFLYSSGGNAGVGDEFFSIETERSNQEITLVQDPGVGSAISFNNDTLGGTYAILINILTGFGVGDNLGLNLVNCTSLAIRQVDDTVAATSMKVQYVTLTGPNATATSVLKTAALPFTWELDVTPADPRDLQPFP